MLYLIATPIGNLGDITLRAMETFEKLDILLCEDTRISGRLLSLLKIKNKPKLISFYDEVEEQKIPQVLGWLEDGLEVGLISDAGTPLISDPGWLLVRKCQEKSIAYTALPGACSLIDALVISGIPMGRFSYLGFLPKNKSARRDILEKYKNIEGGKVAFESPHRLQQLIEEIKNVYGEKVDIKICRELTKKFEEVLKPEELKNTKGEAVVVWI